MPENGDINQEPQDVEAQGTGCFAFPAQILRGARAGGGTSRDDLLALVRERALDPEAIDAETIFFFRSVISNTSLDSWFTHMMPSTLRNFAAEATEGRAFLEGHDTRSRPLGQSLVGRFVGASAAGKARTEVDTFIAPEPSGMGRKTDMIHEIRTGTARDISVGFSLGEDGQYICDLCKRDYLGGECPHMLGTTWNWDTYPKREEAVCTCGIENAHLSEHSSVYDGATPGAAIIKAIRAMEAGTLTPEMARVLEPMYRVKLNGARHTWPGFDVGSNGSVPAVGRHRIYIKASDGIERELGTHHHTSAGDGGILSGPFADAVSVVDRGYAANRGEPGKRGRLYISEDEVFYDDGNRWHKVLNGDSGSLATDSNGKERVMPEDPNTSNTDTGQNTAPPPAAPPPETQYARDTAGDTVFTPPPADPPAEQRTTPPSEWTGEQYAERVNAVLAGREVAAEELAECVRRLSAECVTLRPLAEDGRAYREALVGDVLHQAARAQGKAYDEALEREICAVLSTQKLVQRHNQYKTTADALFASGRVTRDEEEAEPVQPDPPQVPAAAYRA